MNSTVQGVSWKCALISSLVTVIPMNLNFITFSNYLLRRIYLHEIVKKKLKFASCDIQSAHVRPVQNLLYIYPQQPRLKIKTPSTSAPHFFRGEKRNLCYWWRTTTTTLLTSQPPKSCLVRLWRNEYVARMGKQEIHTEILWGSLL